MGVPSSRRGITWSRIEVSPHSSSSVTGARAAKAVRTASSSRPMLGQPLARGVGVDPHAVQRAHGVGAGVADDGLGVEEQDAVADPGRLLGDQGAALERERALVEHAGEAVEDLEVDPLQLAEAPAGGGGGLPGEEGDDLAPVADGDGLHVGPLAGLADDGGVADADLADPPDPGDRAAARPRRRWCRPCRRGTASGRWSAAPGPGPRSGGPPRPPAAPAGGGRRSTGRPASPRRRPGAGGGRRRRSVSRVWERASSTRVAMVPQALRGDGRRRSKPHSSV